MKVLMKFLLITFMTIVSVCQIFAINTKPIILKDIHYGSSAQQVMDVYLVQDRTEKTPLVILIHGGGWMAGDKKDADFMVDVLYKKGVNVININYRLASETIHYREIMNDIDSTLNFVIANADEWKVRKSKYIFWGGSAGAHLSLLYAYNYDNHNIISSIITLGAPVKIDDMNALKGSKLSDIVGLLPLVTGKPWNNNTTLLDSTYRLASPYYGKQFKPTFLIHGNNDLIVPVRQSRMLSRLLKQNNIPEKLFILPNGGHGGENTSVKVMKKLNSDIYKWIQKYSK